MATHFAERQQKSASEVSSGISTPLYLGRMRSDYFDRKSPLASPSPQAEFRNEAFDANCVFVAPVADNEEPTFMLIPHWKRIAIRFFIIPSLLLPILTIWGTWIKSGILLQAGRDGVVSQLHRNLAWMLAGMEACFTVDSLFQTFTKAKGFFSRWRPRLRLLGGNVPSVDVIVTVCNEDIDIVRDTVLGALNIDYPPHRFRVIVSDDGRSPKLEAWVTQMAVTWQNLHYTARIKQGPAGYKAGNLNHALEYTARLPGGPAECLAGLDADMIPEKFWLRTVGAYLVKDPKMAMVCPTQSFYNLPAGDPLFQSNNISWYYNDLAFDLAGMGLNSGSGWIMRRLAVEEIGGFPTYCLVEDLCSSVLVLTEGWRTAYVPVAVQWGLVPETYAAEVKQRTRWFIGGCQMTTRFRHFLFRSTTKHQTLIQRGIGLSKSIALHFTSHVVSMGLIITSVAFLTGFDGVYWANSPAMPLLLRIDCAIVICKWITSCHASLLIGYGNAIWGDCGALYLAPYYTVAYIKSFLLPRHMGGKPTAFTPTGTVADHVHERNVSRRQPLVRRLRYILLDCGAWFHTAISAALILSACLIIRSRLIARNSDPLSAAAGQALVRGQWFQVLRTVAWPTSPWFPTTISCLMPLRYAIAPPTCPDREALMGKRDAGGARYPTPQARRGGSWAALDFQFVPLYTAFVAYVAALFAWSWSIEP